MSKQEDSQLNLSKLKHLIDSGITSIPNDKQHNSAVLVIGDTGVGKTTILSFLAKRKLYIKIHGLNTILDSEQKDGLKIGHDRFSETRVPSKIIIDKLVFFDCSGFKDNRGQQYQISNSFFVQRLFDIYGNIKILLIVDESSVSESRADKLPRLVRNLLKSFSSLNDIQDGVILLINRAKPQFNEKIYSEQLLKMSKLKNEDGYLFNEQERSFIEFLVKNKRVCLFKQAQREDEGKVLDIKEENLLNLIRDTNFVKSKKIKNIISESAKLSIRDFVDHLAEEAEPKIHKLCQELLKDFSYKTHQSFSDSIKAANEVKKAISQFSKQIEEASDHDLVGVIKQHANINVQNFQQDVIAVLFFKTIYNKSDYYFKLIRSNLTSTLAKLLLRVDDDIAVLEKQQKIMNELTQRAQASAKKELELSNQLLAFKKKQQEYTVQINESNKKFSQELNDLETSSKQKDKQILDLKGNLQRINKDCLTFKSENQNQQQIQSDLQNKINIKDKQIEELTILLKNMKFQAQATAEEIQTLTEQNIGLKKQLQNAINQSSVSSSVLDFSHLSKTSKYPEVVCPHFKNGGKCVHCIKAWKNEQKKLKNEQII